MDREALAALEARVSELRLVTAEKAVLARSLAQPEPMRFHAEIATAILAIGVLVAFLLGRELGMFAAHGDSCAPLGPREAVAITYATSAYVVTLDTTGHVMRNAGPETARPGRIDREISPAAVRAIANRLVMGCFLETQPHQASPAGAPRVTLTLSARGRIVTYQYDSTPMPIMMCGGEDLNLIAQAIENVANVNEL